MSKIIVVAGALALAACDSSDNDPPPVNLPAATTVVQILHASPDAPAVDVAVDGEEVLSDVDYKDASGWVTLDSGTYSIDVQAILPGGNLSVLGADLTFEDDTINTVVALNDVQNIEPVVLTQPGTPVSAGAARVWVLHAAANVQELVGGPVDVYVTVPGAELAGAAPLGSFNFKETLPADGPTELTAGDYQIRVGVGTPGDENFLLAFDSGTVTLADGADLVIAAVPNTTRGDSPVSLVVLDSNGAGEILNDGTPAALRVVHASNNTPAVDVFADGAALIEGLAFPNFAPVDGPTEVPAGTYSVAVAPAGDGVEAAAIGPADLEFTAGTTTDVIAVGRLGGTEGTIEELTVTLADDDLRQIPLFAKVRIIHASVTAASLDPDTVDIYVTAPDTDISDESVAPTLVNVPYLANTGYLAVAGGTYDITVTVSGSRTPAIGPLEDVPLEDGGIYTFIARDALPEAAATDLGVIVINDTPIP
ncbi:MAG: hypothetical protein AMS22_00785 [Thiotrichales bacterium SG8_50]|nr:MAG: hypothetical protein AMS22_00785 [Thiotrichales bacterium SG8_50]